MVITVYDLISNDLSDLPNICRKGNRRGNFFHRDWLVFRLGSLSFVKQEKGAFPVLLKPLTGWPIVRGEAMFIPNQ